MSRPRSKKKEITPCSPALRRVAKRAWEIAELEEQKQYDEKKDLGKIRDRFYNFEEKALERYEKLPDNDRVKLEQFIAKNDNLIDWRNVLSDILAELRRQSNLPPGQKKRSRYNPEVSLTGLRAFASVIRDHWDQHSTNKWRSGSGNAGPSPAERFLLSEAKKIDPKVSAANVRSALKVP
jgi:hypothetical protein